MGKKNIAYINPQILKWARSETPFETVEEVVAREPTFSFEKLTAWEDGYEKPSISEAKKLAKLYKLPFAAFFLSNPPAKKPKKYVDRRSVTGASNEISYKVWSEIKRINDIKDCLLEIEDSKVFSGLSPKSKTNTVDDIALSIRSYFELKTPLRNKSAYGHSPFNYFRDIFEQKGFIVAQFTGIEISEMKGFSIWDDVFPVIGINSKDYIGSKVFSLFHEAAHIFRRSSSLCSIDLDDTSNKEEVICNRIAAKTVMPDDIFLKWLEDNNCLNALDTAKIDKIAGVFGVSSLSVLYRLLDTELVSQKDFIDLRQRMEEEFEEKEARSKNKSGYAQYYIQYINQNGYLFPRVVLNELSAKKISLGEACSILGVKSVHLGKIEETVNKR